MDAVYEQGEPVEHGEREKEKGECRPKSFSTNLADIVLGAWVAGTGLTILLLGLSYWLGSLSIWEPEEIFREEN